MAGLLGIRVGIGGLERAGEAGGGWIAGDRDDIGAAYLAAAMDTSDAPAFAAVVHWLKGKMREILAQIAANQDDYGQSLASQVSTV